MTVAVSWDYPPSSNALLQRGASHSRFLHIAYTSHRSPHSPPRRWPKPPHYHASLLRSPTSRRKGLFRAVLSPNTAVDFFRWDVLGPTPPRTRTTDDVPSLHVAEFVLGPYEAAAGFFGWHGLSLWQNGDRCWRPGALEIDEALVDEGRARWARVAEELVGPPGLPLRWLVEDAKLTTPLDPPSGTRWDPGSSRPTSATDEKRKSPPSSSSAPHPGSSKPECRTDSPSVWWYGPPPTPLRFPPPPPVQYGPPPPMHLSPYFPNGRVGHGYWYGGPPSVNRDPNLPKPPPPHAHMFPGPSGHPSHSPRQSIKPSLPRGGYGSSHDCDKETETDHGYESTTTTTDSDPPPHTPVGAATTALQVHGDNEVEGHGIDAGASMTFSLSDPTTPVKLLDRFSTSTPPSVSSGSPDSSRASCESSKAAVVFPSLNGSFCQGSSSQRSVSLSSQATQMTPARIATSTQKRTPPDDVQLRSGLESSISSDNPPFTLSLSSPPTSPGSTLRKDSHGFWEPATPLSPCSSSSSLPLSPSEGKSGSRLTAGWIGEKNAEHPELPEHITLSFKSRSLSPSPRRVSNVASFTSPTPTPASASVFGGSYPSSPSPSNNSLLVPADGTTLLPAFLATSTVKRKKTSRTREIVDRLRSSSIDAGKGGVGLDSLGWLASPSADREVDGKTSGLDHAAGTHVPTAQPLPLPPPKSSSDSAKNHDRTPGSKTSDSSPRGKSDGALETLPASRTVTNPSITPFPILSASQTTTSNFTTMTHRKQNGGNAATHSNTGDGPKMKMATPPTVRTHLPNGGTSPSTHSHHPLPSPPHPIVHPPPPPTPILTVSYPLPMYVPVTQYRMAPPHQGPQGQGTWMAVYPGRPPHLPVHPMPTPVHPPPITGVSGMRHVSW